MTDLISLPASRLRRRKPLQTFQSPSSDTIFQWPTRSNTLIDTPNVTKAVTGAVHNHIGLPPTSSSASTASSSSSGDNNSKSVFVVPQYIPFHVSSITPVKKTDELARSVSLYHPLGKLAQELPLLDPIEDLGILAPSSKRGTRILEKLMAAAAAAEEEREKEAEAHRRAGGGGPGGAANASTHNGGRKPTSGLKRPHVGDRAGKEQEKEPKTTSPRKRRVVPRPKRKRADLDDDDDDSASVVDPDETRSRRGGSRSYPNRRNNQSAAERARLKKKEDEAKDAKEDGPVSRRTTRSRGPAAASRSPSESETLDAEMADA